MVCTIDTNHPAPSRRTGGAIRRSGSIKWGWSLSDPALCDSHLGCPAIYPNFLMTYEIIRLDRRPSWSVCGLRKCSITMWYRLQRCQGVGISSGCNQQHAILFSLRGDSYRPTPRPQSSRPNPTPAQQFNSPGARVKYSGQCSASGAGRPSRLEMPLTPSHSTGPHRRPPVFSTLPRVSLCQSEMLAIPPSPPPFRFDAPPTQTMPGYSYDQPAETPHTTRSHRH